MAGIIERLKEWWLGADKTQRLVGLFGGVFLAALLMFTAWFAGRPKYSPLFAGLSPSDQGLVVDELNAQGIPTQIGSQGTVMVPDDKVEWARMRLAQANKLPNSGPKGMEWLDSLNSFSTPAQERERIKAAKEGELARSIQTMQGVQSAIVHINFGKDSPFSEETIEPSAVVNLKESGETGLSVEQGRAIARLVQNSVPGLKAAHVSVINAAGRMLYDGERADSAEATASAKLQAETAESRRREADLQRRLDMAFGPGNTVAMVQLELDMDAVEKQQFDRELGDKKVLDKATETMTDADPANVGGGSGTEANVPGAPATVAKDGSVKYTSESVSNDYPVTETRTQTVRAAGELKSLTVSVIANQDKITDPTPIQAILDDYLGANNGKAGFSAKVQSVPFDTVAAQEAKKVVESAGSQAKMQQMMQLLPMVALLIAGFMVVKALGKVPGRTLTMALPQGGSVALPAGTTSAHVPSQLVIGEAPTSPNGARTVADLAREEPELAEALQAMGVETLDESVDVEAIRQRIDVPLEQIKKMARTKPQAIAMLLKGWLMEERI